jgi:putative YhdH/YhfP family quinone oxidoreductase
MSTFKALLVEKTEAGFTRQIVDRDEAELPDGDVVIDVAYSSLNYKDALSATGNPGVTRNFPHTPGIDAAGTVRESRVEVFKIRVPAGWVVPRPEGLTLEQSMILGTAGFTAALCVHKLTQAGMTPDSGPVLVTGASGGVGSVAVMLLAQLGYAVTAVTGKPDQHDFLREIGADQIISREDAREGADRPLGKETWGGVVDTVGGEILFNAVKSLKYGCSLAACGLVDSPAIPATVLPFILRHVNLLGVDSVQLPLAQKTEIWDKLAGPWQLPQLPRLAQPLSLETLSDALDRILAGQMVGRGLLVHG